MGICKSMPGLLLVSLLLFCVPTHAAVQGHVIDSSQNPIAGALVTFTDESNPERSFSGYTDEDGWYQIDLAPLAVGDEQPHQFALGQNYPNPFNPSTIIPFSLDTASHVSLTIYNIMGQKIADLADQYMSAGQHTAVWDGMDDNGKHVSAGIYLYRLQAGRHFETRKMLLLDGGGVSGGSAAKPFHRTAKIADEGTYTVTITHDDIIPYEETGVKVEDGELYNFNVTLIGEYHVFRNITFASIPGGIFRMGDLQDYNEYDREKPVHEVALSSFEMSIYEITNAQYAAYLNASIKASRAEVDTLNNVVTWRIGVPEEYKKDYFRFNNRPWGSEILYTNGKFTVEPEKENYPVFDVTWYGAKDFALYYGFDLPTEAEWEYACRAGTETLFYTGNNISSDGETSSDLDLAGWYIYNYDTDSISPYTHEVGKKQKNAWGLYDMHGNVQEWCHDWYGEYSRENVLNPTGPTWAKYRVVRNGASLHYAMNCRSAYRGSGHPMFSHGDIGFRVVRRKGGMWY